MQQMQLVFFVLAMAAWVVCGSIFTWKPRKKLPPESCGQRFWTNVSPAVSVSKKKEAVIGRAAAHRSSKKLDRLCDHLLPRDEARRVAANIAKLPELLR